MEAKQYLMYSKRADESGVANVGELTDENGSKFIYTNYGTIDAYKWEDKTILKEMTSEEFYANLKRGGHKIIKKSNLKELK